MNRQTATHCKDLINNRILYLKREFKEVYDLFYVDYRDIIIQYY